MTSHYWQTAIRDFEESLEDSDDYNVIIKAGEGSDAMELRAHSFVLRARCSYFKRALSSDWEDRDDNGNFIFKKPNISFDVFELILRYLYTGIVNYSQYSRKKILQFLVAADELGLNELVEFIQEYLIKNEKCLKDPVSTLQIVYQHETFEKLRNHCLEIISDEPKVLFSSQKFPTLEKPIITMVLERDDLNMEEIEIWESLHRWISVHYLLNDEDSTSEDIADVKQTIQEYIPLIRFYDISRENFYLKVYPYKDLLPQDLLNDLFRYHMVPNSTPMLNYKPSRSRKVNSVLINYRLFLIFAKWIDKKEKDDDYTMGSIPYQFNLLLRGTIDGFDVAKFHQLCDNKGATLVVARIKGSKQIVGGYNPLNWNSSGSYANTSKSYLFYVTDCEKSNTAKFSRANRNQSNAIYNYSSYGPAFGGGCDLYSQGNTWYVDGPGNTYANIGIPSNFTIDEYEVFQVMKK